MALAFGALELLCKGGEGREIAQMIVVDVDIQVVSILRCQMMIDHDGSIFFEVAGSDAHLETMLEEIELRRRQSGVIFRVFRQDFAPPGHECTPFPVVLSDCSLPLSLLVMDGQTPEGAQMILIFSHPMTVQGHDIGIVLDVVRKPAPSHGEECSVDVDHHDGHEVDLPVRAGPAETGIIGDSRSRSFRLLKSLRDEMVMFFFSRVVLRNGT